MVRTRNASGFLALLAFVLLVSAALAQEVVHWSYEGEEGPEHWGELSPDFALCATGMEQSPVDIPVGAPLLPGDALALDYQPSALTTRHTGHSVQVNYDAGSVLTVDGVPYELLQFHFHTPSEHTLNGEHTPAEVHLVHRDASGALAVVGVLIREGAPDEALGAFWEHVPAGEGEAETIEGASVDAAALLPANREHYRYAGSLTTPPCSEGVKWHVLAAPIEMSAGQIAALLDAVSANNRPVQPLNARSFLAPVAAPSSLPASGGAAAWPLPALLFGLGALLLAAARRDASA